MQTSIHQKSLYIDRDWEKDALFWFQMSIPFSQLQVQGSPFIIFASNQLQSLDGNTMLLHENLTNLYKHNEYYLKNISVLLANSIGRTFSFAYVLGTEYTLWTQILVILLVYMFVYLLNLEKILCHFINAGWNYAPWKICNKYMFHLRGHW